MYKFKTYDATALKECGAAFLADVGSAYKPPVKKADEPATEEWTEFVLDWFAHAAADGVLVDGRRSDTRARWQTRWKHLVIAPRQCSGEFMLDLVHSTYPGYEVSPFKAAYWEKATADTWPTLELKLALESEWGKHKQPEATLCAVMADAIKVASIRAAVKVMVYGCEDEKHSTQLSEMLTRLRLKSGDDAPWLCIGVPWNLSKEGTWRCSAEVLAT